MRIIVNNLWLYAYLIFAHMPRPLTPKKSWLAHYSELIGAWRRKGAWREDGEDAMQDAALAILENGVGTMDDARAYLARSTANGLINRHRRRSILTILPLDELDEAEHPLAPNPEAAAYSQELACALSAALDELPLKCQQVYIRHRLEGWSHAEIAQSMGLSRSMVEKYMQRALQHLTERLQNYAPY
jgi:RNA polymerase sigma-70 factor (ECF subfamily)